MLFNLNAKIVPLDTSAKLYPEIYSHGKLQLTPCVKLGFLLLTFLLTCLFFFGGALVA
uniref:Uncharacterized protein n=1 Tax=Rhizophora mucronata TaxID=61149 RepID=A0A2P2Q951_RHIMU